MRPVFIKVEVLQMEDMILTYDNICRNKSHFYLDYERMKKNVFIERLSANFEKDVPIFTEEIIKLFPDYSRAQIFRFIEKAKENEEIIQYSQCRGVYHIPHTTYFGTPSIILPEDILYKRYISYKDDFYGVYSGISVLNRFAITSQVPAVIEIVTNNETTRSRMINIGKQRFIVKKSRCKITKENHAAYEILQLFTDFDDSDRLYGFSRRCVTEYVKENNVKKADILSIMPYFPKKALEHFARSNIIDVLA